MLSLRSISKKFWYYEVIDHRVRLYCLLEGFGDFNVSAWEVYSNIEGQINRAPEFKYSVKPFPSVLEISSCAQQIFMWLQTAVSDSLAESKNTPLSPLAALL